MRKNLAVLLAFRAFVFAGCAWLVWHGWSPWWFVLAVLICPLYDGQITDETRK